MALRRSYLKDKRIAFFGGIRLRRNQNLTGLKCSTGWNATAITTYGLSVVAPAAGTGTAVKLKLPSPGPGMVGTQKRIVCLNATSTADVCIVNFPSSRKFAGSTGNGLTLSTAYDQLHVIDLVAYSSSQWGVVPAKSTAAKKMYTLGNVTS